MNSLTTAKTHKSMKIITKEDIDVNSNKLYVLKTKDSLDLKSSGYYLHYEKNLYSSGWIFRPFDSQTYGHSGFWPTAVEAVTKAFELDSTDTILEFDSFLELAAYLLTH